MKRKLAESAEAGIRYWKVDWGVHHADVAYRELMSELALKYAPETVVDHSCGFDNAVNGYAYPYNPPKLLSTRISSCRDALRIRESGGLQT